MASLSFQIQSVTGTGASEWEAEALIAPFIWRTRGPYQHDGINCAPNGQQLRDHEYAWAVLHAHQERREMVRHGMCVVGEQDSSLPRGKSQHVRILKAECASFRRRKHVNACHPAAQSTNDRLTEIFVREEPNRFEGIAHGRRGSSVFGSADSAPSLCGSPDSGSMPSRSRAS